MSSLFRRAYTFSAIRLTSPHVFVGIDSAGKINLEDIRRDTAATKESAAETNAEAKEDTAAQSPLRLVIQELAIDSGRIVFEDRARAVPFRAAIDSLGLSLHDFTTLPNEAGEYQFEASTGRNELIRWKGNVSVVPLHSAGSFELKNIQMRRFWEYLRDRVNFEASTGSADFQSGYMFDFSRDTILAELNNGALAARDVRLTSTVDSVVAVQLPSLNVSGIRMNYAEQKIAIGSISTENLVLSNVLSADGRITLKDMFVPKNPSSVTPAKAVTPPAKSAASPPKSAATSQQTAANPPGPGWKISIQNIDIKSTMLRNEDRSTNPPGIIEVAPLDLTVGHLRLDAPEPAAVSVSTSLNGSGSIKIYGTMTVDAGRAEIDAAMNANITGIQFAPFQPYLSPYAKMEIKSGEASCNGNIRFTMKNGKQSVDYDGDASCVKFRVTDTVLRQDFLRFTALELKKISFRQSERTFSVRNVTMRQPYIRMIIGPDRVTNIQNMMITDTTKEDSASVANAPPEAPAAPEEPPMKIRIANVRIIDGSTNFADLSLKPNFVVGIQELNGTVKGLSSAELSRAQIDLAGKVDKYAPAVIKGQINPLSEDAYTDVTMSFQGIELTTFTPYSGRFAGYKIEKGKLNVYLHYKLNKSKLEAENKIVFDQLVLGEKVESPDATSLPVKLAVALLMDSHGKIDVDIPVSGDINDPEFSVFPLVVQGLGNLCVKVVTAPFKWLGGVFGGEEAEELNYVEFPAGSDSLFARQEAKLEKLAKALTERPALSLEVRGITVDSIDSRAIATAAVCAMIRPPVNAAISPEDFSPPQRKSVERLYEETFKDDPEKLLPPSAPGTDLTDEEIERAVTRAAFERLVQAHAVSQEELRALAVRRADAVKSVLVFKRGIGEERVFITGLNTDAPARDGLIQMELALQAN